jgi:poly(3-hydroxybutyrate) depolymerase
VTPDEASCSYLSRWVFPFLTPPRQVHYQLPLTPEPAGGYPTVIYFQGSVIPSAKAFEAASSEILGQYQLTRTLKALLDRGYAVLAPESMANISWQTNIPPYMWAWTTSQDHQLMMTLFAEIEAGHFGHLDSNRLYATGISSGGFMTSRMAANYPGHFKALAIHDASWATCGPVCVLPASLPHDHPPTLFLHGLLDPAIPISTMEDYLKALNAQGTPTRAVVFWGGHEWSPQAIDELPAWFDQHP